MYIGLSTTVFHHLLLVAVGTLRSVSSEMELQIPRFWLACELLLRDRYCPSHTASQSPANPEKKKYIKDTNTVQPVLMTTCIQDNTGFVSTQMLFIETCVVRNVCVSLAWSLYTGLNVVITNNFDVHEGNAYLTHHIKSCKIYLETSLA